MVDWLLIGGWSWKELGIWGFEQHGQEQEQVVFVGFFFRVFEFFELFFHADEEDEDEDEDEDWEER